MFKKFQALGKAIKSIKPNVPKTELQKKIRDLKISTQKNKASKGSAIEQILALSKTLELMTDKPNRNVNDVIRKLKNG